MPKDFLLWSKWSPHIGNAITIATGLPVLTAMGAGLWAVISPSRGLLIALVVLAAFIMVLWAGIGMVWLWDRFEEKAPNASRTLLDCSWGLVVDGVQLTRDLSTGTPAEWQIKVAVRNTCTWPLRMEIVEQSTVIENLVPDVAIQGNMPFIIIPNSPATVNFPGYSKGSLLEKERFKGTINLTIRYGHPDGDPSRVMTRRFAFEQIIKPTLPVAMSSSLFPMMGAMPLSFWPVQQDRDEPYLASN